MRLQSTVVGVPASIVELEADINNGIVVHELST